MNNKMDITLLIPTFNRPHLLLRALSYYKSVGYHGKILIGDSSETDLAKKITDLLPNYTDTLNVTYRYLPGCGIGEVLTILANEANTSYVAVSPDDDYLVPSGLSRCLDFLDTHLDYIAAHGIGISINSQSSSWQEIDRSYYYQQTISEETTAIQRLIQHLSKYTVSLFSVHRTEVWRAMFKDVPGVKDKSFADELLSCCLSVVYGKIKQLDGLYLVRHDHGARYLLPTWFKWISSDAWHQSYLTFRDRIAEAMAQVDGIPLNEAVPIVEDAFSSYLKSCIPTESNQFEWMNRLRWIPGARFAWHTMLSLRDYAFPNKLSLRTILNPTSPYHNDFLPIYNIVVSSRAVGS